jgi:hypothetical protein
MQTIFLADGNGLLGVVLLPRYLLPQSELRRATAIAASAAGIFSIHALNFLEVSVAAAVIVPSD